MDQNEIQTYCQWAEECLIAYKCFTGRSTLGLPSMIIDDEDIYGKSSEVVMPCGRLIRVRQQIKMKGVSYRRRPWRIVN